MTQNRRQVKEVTVVWKWLCLVLGAVVGIGTLTAAALHQDTIEAKEFILRGEDGKVRAALTLRSDGTPALSFLDREGKTRLSVEMSGQDLPSVNLYGPQGIQAALAVRNDGTPGFALFSESGSPRASLDLGADGSSGINVYQDSGTLRAAVAIRADGTPALGLFDEKGQIARSIEIER